MGEKDPMGRETRNFGGKFGSQGITTSYPYSRYNGGSTNEVDLYMYLSSCIDVKCEIHEQ